ncbi:hypothetical protein SAMN04487970_105912 [Paenibacillus tianmuensis]|uniref:Uncharacterized protein n=1 Tax=Paenibacillus tianmuensis TaxID=624147 RepID=A0A1G4TNP1_9BACL|nr:hypothetical protein SAMN04487970_105912 [Paenibacillus tianmuensis]
MTKYCPALPSKHLQALALQVFRAFLNTLLCPPQNEQKQAKISPIVGKLWAMKPRRKPRTSQINPLIYGSIYGTI